MKPKIAVVRGHYFYAGETRFFEPLSDEFDITFFSSIKGNHETVAGIQIAKVSCLDSALDKIGLGGAYRKVGGVINNMVGVDPEIVLNLKKTLTGFDMVHTIDYDFAVTHQLAKLKNKLKYKLVALHWENIPFARDKMPIGNRMKYFNYNHLDAFFAMSERAKASLMLEGVEEPRIFVTGYGLDTERFSPREEERLEWRRRYNFKPDDIVLLFVGRVRASKGIFELVYAIRRLIQNHGIDPKKLKLLIVGKGPMEKELDRRISFLGLEENVIRTGYIPHSEIHLVHNMADIFTLPSIPRKYWQEQLGLVFLEAMACGKPVVSTLSGSIPEIVDDAGILVQPNDHLSLSEVLNRLIVDEKLREALGKKGRDRVTRHFSIDIVSEKMREAYRKVLGKNVD